MPSPVFPQLASPLPLSVAIICRNNADTIGRTLESVAGMGVETIAVDSGSTDGTLLILEQHGARIIHTEWKGHVATKQLALEACTQAWILSLDSDESLTPLLRQAIEQALTGWQNGAGPDGFLMNRKVFYRDRPLNFVWQPEHRLRLVRQGKARWTGLDPHDKLELVSQGPTPLLEGHLRHDSIGTFAEFFAKQAVHARTMAMSMRAEGQRGNLLSLLISPSGAFLKQLVLKQAWRDGWPGWLAAASTAAASLMKHAMLIELTQGLSSATGIGPASSAPAARGPQSG